MGLFGKPKAGGFMDEIRCDESSYLVWKWHPNGSTQDENNRENAIRWGSSLRVKDGEVAVFVHSNESGNYQDFIEGPADLLVETNNLPIIASIIGLAYEGGTPFQAEVYFINVAKIIQAPFAVPFFDVFDAKYKDFGVPISLHGTITFNIKDCQAFIKLHRLYEFNQENFQKQIKDAVIRICKRCIYSITEEKNISALQIERYLPEMNDAIESEVKERLEKDFGVNLTSFDINRIEVDKTSDGYLQLKSITKDVLMETTKAEAETNIKNIHDMQRINIENTEESARINREESQYAMHKQTQSSNMDALRVEKQAEVGVAGAEALGHMGTNGAMEMSGSGGMNPAGMMTGMAMGTSIGQNMVNIMGEMSQGLNNKQQSSETQHEVPPPIHVSAFFVAINGEPSEPLDLNTMRQMVDAGSLTGDSLVWKHGMKDWVKASSVEELKELFSTNDSWKNEMPPIPSDNN